MQKDNGHFLDRSESGFREHRRERGSAKVRRGAAWRFMPALWDIIPNQPHYRVTSRMAALPGNHVRSVPEPVREAHCKAH